MIKAVMRNRSNTISLVGAGAAPKYIIYRLFHHTSREKEVGIGAASFGLPGSGSGAATK
jgi:hypothetical protein